LFKAKVILFSVMFLNENKTTWPVMTASTMVGRWSKNGNYGMTDGGRIKMATGLGIPLTLSNLMGMTDVRL